MIVRTLDELRNTDREVVGVGFKSLRYVLAKDGMGFSLHRTEIPAGTKEMWHYKHHLEACCCIGGGGWVTDLGSGKTYRINVGTTYILDKHDKHLFRAEEDTVLISVFNPPCTGAEIHQEDGSYKEAENV